MLRRAHVPPQAAAAAAAKQPAWHCSSGTVYKSCLFVLVSPTLVACASLPVLRRHGRKGRAYDALRASHGEPLQNMRMLLTITMCCAIVTARLLRQCLCHARSAFACRRATRARSPIAATREQRPATQATLPRLLPCPCRRSHPHTCVRQGVAAAASAQGQNSACMRIQLLRSPFDQAAQPRKLPCAGREPDASSTMKSTLALPGSVKAASECVGLYRRGGGSRRGASSQVGGQAAAIS